MSNLREDAEVIIHDSIEAVLPDEAVRKTLDGRDFGKGKVILVSVGKAAWQMAKAAHEVLLDRIDSGIVITKYGHVKGKIANLVMVEAGHPVSDENSYRGTQLACDMVSDLKEEDTVLFLLSGGGSALFEKPFISHDELENLNRELLASGADIRAINTIRKRMSQVKGGRFAKKVYPAKVVQIILSDIVGDPLDMIASGPAACDSSTCEEAKAIAEKYNLTLSEKMKELLEIETPDILDNVETHINGSVRALALAAKQSAEELGYKTIVLTDCLECEAKDAGLFLGAIAKSHRNTKESLAFIAGGETVVHLNGDGKGGRNQEIALAAATVINGLYDTAVFSLGSDGTDGPCDAAGGFVSQDTIDDKISGCTMEDAKNALLNNDSYTFLEKTDGLIMTGPTGTNVNDVSVVLIRR